MRPTLALLLLAGALCAAEPEFPITEDSKPQPNVAKGTMLKETYIAKDDSVFPGTQREYQVYLPAGHDASKPAAFMVFQDGVIYQAPTVFDNLIAKKDIPAMIGIFIKPGVVPAANENALPRFNRSHEYDSVTDVYSQFLIDEFLPAIEAKHKIKLSTDPNHAAISGNSSGGICAFMAAWHRPDRFRRVFTGVGTYVGIHGADRLPVLVRKIEPKPIRVFLQSGTGDNNLYCGDWWMANQTMERSLAWAGYEVNHAWGEGGHNGKHATQIFPDVLRWLWKDWQMNIEVKANAKGESKWKGYEIFEAGSKWGSADDTTGFEVKDPNESVADARMSKVRAVYGMKPTLGRPFGIGGFTASPDQTLLYISGLSKDPNSVESSQLDAERSLQHSQDFYLLDVDYEGGCNPGGMCVDTDGRLYVATTLGVQVCDQAGRVNFIIPTPETPTDVCFGGKDSAELVIRCGTQSRKGDQFSHYARPTKIKGVPRGQRASIKPAAPKL